MKGASVNRVVLGATVAALLALGAAPGAGATTVGAACPGPREGSTSAPGEHRFAQSFAPAVSGALTAAEVEITNDPATSGDWVVQLVESEVIPIGAPNDAVLASATVPDASVPNGRSTITAKFADPVTVVPGSNRRTYKLAITRPGSTDFTVGYREGNDCAGQLFRSGAQTGLFTPVAGGTRDLVFRVLVEDVAPPRTRIVARPSRRTKRRGARFHVRSSEPGSSFECRLDREPFDRCDPRERVRVGPGKHRFRARATDPAGNVDPTPARARWRVVP